MPAIVADTHDEAGERFIEFFAATIRNRNTRAAYVRAVSDFLGWQGVAGLASLREIRPLHVAAYIEECGDRVSAPTVKLRLAALRGLFDWLVRSGIIDSNPAHAVRGPTHEVVRGKTPILSPEETRRLLESIPTDTVVQLRDRALIALMTYSFARVSAAVGMNVEDLVQTAGRSWVRLREKRGKVHELPIHHKLLDHLHNANALGSSRHLRWASKAIGHATVATGRQSSSTKRRRPVAASHTGASQSPVRLGQGLYSATRYNAAAFLAASDCP